MASPDTLEHHLEAKGEIFCTLPSCWYEDRKDGNLSKKHFHTNYGITYIK